MVKRKREFWDYVETVKGGLKCRFCQFVFLKRTSITRIKAHLSGDAGLADNICGQAPDNVKAEAFEEIRSVNKRLKTMPSSSANESRNVVPTSSQGQTNENEAGERGYSHDWLNNKRNQECLLYCALFPKDFEIQREEIIEYLILEGIIKGKNRHSKYDMGHDTINNCLSKGWLLEDWRNNRFVKMHGSIRDMAIQNLREKSSAIVKPGEQLRKIPYQDDWTDSLKRVSLMENNIHEIPSSHSPHCPKLSTLLLGSNRKLGLIADSFFTHLHGLKVLNLSNTRIVKLPNSISKLKSLVALLMNLCVNLKYIPSLNKLTKLQKLDLSETGLEKLPEGMNLLSKLKYLNLRGSKVKEITGILPNLSHLQILILNNFWGSKARISVPRKEEIILVSGNEVSRLRKLESLECYFKDFSDFRECMKDLSLHTYNIQIGQCSHGSELSKSKQGVYFCGCCISTEDDFKAFPKDIEELLLENCSFGGITLFDDSSLSPGCLRKLKYIYLYNCRGIKSLVSLPCHLRCPETLRLSKLKEFHEAISIPLQYVRLFNLKKFHAVISGPLQSVGLFSNLKHFEIQECHKVERLFPIGLLSTLQNLEILAVCFCDRMEEIQAREEEDDNEETEEDIDEEEDDEDDEEGERPNNLFIEFPQLKTLELKCLPKLKRIFSGVMSCKSLKEIQILKCPKLKRIPFACSLQSVKQVCVYPKEWWETVAWDHFREKNLLRPPILKIPYMGE